MRAGSLPNGGPRDNCSRVAGAAPLPPRLVRQVVYPQAEGASLLFPQVCGDGMRSCQDCGEALTAPYAVYCAMCRPKHRGKPAKYVLTPHIEAYLRMHYDVTSGRGMSHRLAKALNVPKWRICRWACYLGLSRTVKPAPWSLEESALLERFIGKRSPEWIQRHHLKARSVTAICVKAKRMQFSRRDFDDYTGRQLAVAFGVDAKTVGRWIEQGKLKATRWGTARTPAQHGDHYRITQDAVRRFVREHPSTFDLRKVDQLWFLDLVFGSHIGAREDSAA